MNHIQSCPASSSSRITVTLSRDHLRSQSSSPSPTDTTNSMTLAGTSIILPHQNTRNRSATDPVSRRNNGSVTSTSAHIIPDNGNAIRVPAMSMPSKDEIRAVERKLDDLTKKLEKELELSAKSKSPVACCASCRKPIMKKEDGCRAFSQCYHMECFRCSICQRMLTGQVFYEVTESKSRASNDRSDDCKDSSSHSYSNHSDGDPVRHLFCQEDYLYSGFRLAVDICDYCEQPVMATENEKLYCVKTLDRVYHVTCFRCTICGRILGGKEYTIDDKYRVVCVPEPDSGESSCLEIALGVNTDAQKPQPQQASRSSPPNNGPIVKYTWSDTIITSKP